MVDFMTRKWKNYLVIAAKNGFAFVTVQRLGRGVSPERGLLSLPPASVLGVSVTGRKLFSGAFTLKNRLLEQL